MYCIYQSCGHVSARVRHPSSRGNTPLSSAIYCPDPLHKMKYLTHSSSWPGICCPRPGCSSGVKMLNLPQFSRCYHQQATQPPSGAVQYSTVQYSTVQYSTVQYRAGDSTDYLGAVFIIVSISAAGGAGAGAPWDRHIRRYEHRTHRHKRYPSGG